MTSIPLLGPLRPLLTLLRSYRVVFEPIGNDGLRRSERNAMAARYAATTGARPTPSPERTHLLHLLAGKVEPHGLRG